MIRSIVLAFAFLIAVVGNADAAITFTARKANNSNAAGGTSVAATVSSSVAGNFIAIGVGWCGDASCGAIAGTVSSVTSSNSGSGETCSQVTNAQGSSGNGQLSDIWYCPNIAGGNDTITVNFSTTVFYAFVALSEFSGVATTTPADSVGNNGGSAATASISISTNGATAVTGELIFSTLTGSASSVTAGQNSINNLTTPNAWGQVDDYQIAGAPGTYTNTYTQGSGKAAYSIAAFKPPAAGTSAGILTLTGAGR